MLEWVHLHVFGASCWFLVRDKHKHAASQAVGSIPKRHHRRPKDLMRPSDTNQEDDESQEVLQHTPSPLDEGEKKEVNRFERCDFHSTTFLSLLTLSASRVHQIPTFDLRSTNHRFHPNLRSFIVLHRFLFLYILIFLNIRFHRTLPLSLQVLNLSRESQTIEALPTMWSSGTKPQKRESALLWRLSPIMK